MRKAIVTHPSKSASDAEFICEFVSEICRNKETKEALATSTILPTGNWVHVFEHFREVVDAIQTQAFAGLPVEHVTLRRLLIRELLELLRQSLVKFQPGQTYSPRLTVELFHKEHILTIESKRNECTDVNTKRWDSLSTFSIHLLGTKYNTLVLQRALESSAFLEFDLTSGAYKEEPVYEALYILQEEIRRFNMANTSETMSVIFAHTPRVRRPGAHSISIETMKLLPLLHLFDRWINIIELSKSIIL